MKDLKKGTRDHIKIKKMPSKCFVNPYSDNLKGVEIDDKLWKGRIKELISIVKKNQKTGKQDFDGGLYVGVAGVAYMLWYTSLRMPDDFKEMETANKLAEDHYKFCETNRPRDEGDKLGFLLGNTGIYAMKAVIANTVGEHNLHTYVDKFKSASTEFKSPDPLGVGSDEFLVGRAGYLAGALWLQQHLSEVEVLTQVEQHQLCNIMVECGRKYSKHVKSPSPLMYQYYGTEYLGAAHGLAGILHVLIKVPSFLSSNPKSEKYIKGSIDFLLSIQTPEGNFPCAMDEIESYKRRQGKELFHWCHGAPGTVYLLATASLVWPSEKKYIEALTKAANITWQKGLLKKGPGICHGVAGSGYVFLLMFRLTGNQVYLNRAQKYAEFLYEDQFKTARLPLKSL